MNYSSLIFTIRYPTNYHLPEKQSYKQGFEDARHLASEIAIEADREIESLHASLKQALADVARLISEKGWEAENRRLDWEKSRRGDEFS